MSIQKVEKIRQIESERKTKEAPLFFTDKQVASRYSISRPTVWRWVNEGIFPAPVKLGPSITRWRAADLDAWEANISN